MTPTKTATAPQLEDPGGELAGGESAPLKDMDAELRACLEAMLLEDGPATDLVQRFGLPVVGVALELAPAVVEIARLKDDTKELLAACAELKDAAVAWLEELQLAGLL